jgi:hypothetical protein
MCAADAVCLKRQIQLRSHLLRLIETNLKSSIHSTSIGQLEALRESVWVDGTWLRSILACPLEICEDLVSPKSQICVHGKGIHPRNAYSGKLIPKKFFDELMRTTRCIYNIQEVDIGISSKKYFFFPSEINCQLCSHAYVSSLKDKISFVKRLQSIYQYLDIRNEVSINEGCNQYIYAVSKSFISIFRKTIGNILKTLQKIDPMAEGLNSFCDISFTSLHTTEIDKTVNSSILCKSVQVMLACYRRIFLIL